MSPAPDVNPETAILSSTSNTTVLNAISSSEQLNQNSITEQVMDPGSLTINSMESRNSSKEDDIPRLVEDDIPQLTICSAPSTPTGEHDPPVIFRKSSILAFPITTSSNIYTLPQDDVRYEGVRNNINRNSGDSNSCLDKFFGCFKPFLSAMNKFSGNIKSNKETTSTLIKSNDDWEIPIENIVNNLKLIGVGIEGSVFHGKLNGQDIACKRVKSKEDTNIKHLKKLNHINVIKFRGISISPSSYYIIMEYCANGSLYDVLKQYREIDSCTKATQVLDWSKQISNGVDYLHSNKIVHRDLKSPNILFFDRNTLKISDFGTSKQLVNRRSQIMSFNGTSAWMAPEVIKKEPCSEKIDVWSFGIILWEMITCAVPYNNIDAAAVIWGVAKGSLNLPIPSSIPEGFKSLMTMCWKQQPSNRPTFQQIITYLDIKKSEIILFEQEQEYAELTRLCSREINENLTKYSTIDISSIIQLTNEQLIEKRKEEFEYIADIRKCYEIRIQQINKLYIELKTLMIELEQREQIIKQKEYLLNIKGKKRTIYTISKARQKSLEIFKAATRNFNDPINLLSQKKRHMKKENKESSNSKLHNTSKQSTNTLTLLSSSTVTNTKIQNRRKKGSDHNRNNSEENATSLTVSNLSAIEVQEKKRSSINTTNDKFDSSSKIISTTRINSPLPSISAIIDSKSNENNCELNPKNLKVNFKKAINELNFPSNKQQSSTDLPILSGKEYYNQTHYHTFPRQRRRRYININNNNNKTKCSSSITSPSTKFHTSNDQHSTQIDDHCQTNDLRKHSRYVKFHLSPPSIINDRKIIKNISYTSSEEDEVEDNHSDNYILDDEKHRAKYNHSFGNFSSESEIYGEKNNHSSSKNDGGFSDEGGQISDNRPMSRESTFNSEPEHE
ncbi:unnamed protein product [Rotaria sordida]|uniref:Mitogen-activated protein kinase kinase kinase n=1 Tax=Rotaria sordida TaxID=392033 RepID=A0A814B3F6_9BILA|nr:unnamed protein product [Rotaria sordida]CAF1067846.1 unnamed protein product [Rotaria sordida]